MNQALIGLIGAILGGVLCYLGSKSAAKESIVAQRKIFDDNKSLEMQRLERIACTNAKVIYLDILTAVNEGFRVIKELSRPIVGSAPNLLPIYNEYSKAIAYISDMMTPEELILINKVYGIIEKIRSDIFKLSYTSDQDGNINFDYHLLLVEIYADEYLKMIQHEPSTLTINFLLEWMPLEYKTVMNKLKGIGNISM